MGRSTAARAEARFKQLCCLGLGGAAVMPALLNELRAVVPALASSFMFADENGACTNAYDEQPDSALIAPLYMQVFHDKRDREIPGSSYADAMRTQFGVHDFADAVAVDVNNYHRSDIYNLIFRALRRDSNFLRLIVRERGRGLGCVTMYRSLGAPTWSPEDKQRLAALEPFFVHALRDRRDCEAMPLVESGKSGLIVADPAGKPVYFSAEGKRLLLLATHSRVAPDTAFSRLAGLPPPVVQLCRNLSRIFSDDAAASAPVYHHRNIWGGFTFRAHWLKGNEPASGLVGINVSHEEPLAVKLVRRVGELALSRRQAEVCVLMATGYSHESIADRLGISRHTAIVHGRWIYNKLDVHNRAELVGKLLSG